MDRLCKLSVACQRTGQPFLQQNFVAYLRLKFQHFSSLYVQRQTRYVASRLLVMTSPILAAMQRTITAGETVLAYHRTS